MLLLYCASATPELLYTRQTQVSSVKSAISTIIVPLMLLQQLLHVVQAGLAQALGLPYSCEVQRHVLLQLLSRAILVVTSVVRTAAAGYLS